MKRHFIPALISFILLLAAAENARSQQWNQVSSLPNISIFTTPYFLNANTGFVYESDGLSPPHLLKTTDGGASWTALSYFDQRNIFLRQIYFTDSSRGYAAAADGVYETQDMGTTWRKIYRYNLPINSIYAFGNKVFAFSALRTSQTSANWGPLIETSNDGNTWDTVITKTTYSTSSVFQNLTRPYVFGNNDSIVYAESIDTSLNMSLVYSTDNGKNWSSNSLGNLNNNITMGYFSFPHCRDILITSLPENDTANADNYFIMHSANYGANWNTLFVPLEIGAWIAGNNCVQYVSDAEGAQKGKNRNGVWRSEDRGMNWTYINGPDFTEIDDLDYHNLSVTGNGSVVYAGDSHLNLWKTTTGGDGTLSTSSYPSGIAITQDLIPAATICDTSFLNISTTNLTCNFAVLKKVTISGLDSSTYHFRWIHHLACDGLPDNLVMNIFSIPSGVTSFTVHLHFLDDEFNATDTIFNFTLSPNGVATTLAISQDVLPATFICDTSKLILAYQNFSCSFADLKSFSISGLDSTQFSYIVRRHPALDSVPDTVLVKIFPLNSGANTYTIHAHFVNTQSQSIDTSFNFTLPPQAIPVTTFSQQNYSLSGSPGDTIETPLFALSTKDSTGILTATLTYLLNTDLLTPIIFIPVQGISADPIKYTKTQASVTLHFDTSFKFNGMTGLGKMRYVAYVTDTLETDIHLIQATHTSGCLNTLADTSAGHFTLTGCGTTSLSHFLKNGDSVDITGIIPNPAKNTVYVRLKNNGALIQYQLLDALGGISKSGMTSRDALQIDLSGLSSGNYYFRITNGGGIPVTKHIIIQH